ncbi:hypothetical protein PILCRDRAFT_817567 [Piloderma croceum F 1598]|uniref:PHD-type domain-containing protein n=1 Tax=Piloderma croceum (strain F 1598) TaxID=765440 RepID=A0A0C3G2D3_PILCF|nr:hypothetical protein PILCRDRAFT_817567 [Piloderma croceum F 1598]
MKNDDEAALWRIEPIGYDAKSNAYWLIGADRLWIQRPLPKLPQNRKRKRPATGDATGHKGKRTASEPATKRDKKHVDDPNHDVVTPKSNRTPGRSARRGASQQGGTVSAGRGGGRAAKTQAKMKMDKQAKDLAEFQRQAATAEKTKGKSSAQAPPPPRGTRLSKRLRGSTEEDDWQPVPDEWLAEGEAPAPAKALPKTGLESDDESALTSLSDEEDETADGIQHEEADSNQPGMGGEFDKEQILDDRGLEVPPEMPSDFVEWETIAVTLYEWEHVAERFEKATHYTEKALYKVLAVDIVPIITAELKEIIRQRQLEEALVHRKRSSRIAIKESEKEEAELAAKKQAEDNEKMSRARRLEARQRKEEAEREKRENAREQRRREREQRELQAQQGSKRRRDASAEIDVIGDAPPSKKPYTNGVSSYQPRQANGSTSASGSGTRTPAGEDWELDCEICYRRGINQDDGQPMMSCGICNKWQHIPCHDSADLRAGRRQRDWDIEEFICQRCRSRGSQKYDGANQPRQYQSQSSGRSQQPHTTDRATYIQPTVNFSAPRAHSGYVGVQSYAASTPNGQNGHDNFRTSTSMTQQRPYQPHSAITFAHYQPDPAGFSTRQIYQRDLPSNSQAYQRQSPYAGRPSQPLQPEVATNFSPIQSPPSYGNGAWNSGQQNYAPYSTGAGFAAGVSHSQDLNPPYAGIPQWQPSPQAADPRGQTSNHYQQYQQPNPVMGSTSYQLPR